MIYAMASIGVLGPCFCGFGLRIAVERLFYVLSLSAGMASIGVLGLIVWAHHL